MSESTTRRVAKVGSPTYLINVKIARVYESKQLSDVSVEVEGQSFKAHKLLLALQSDVSACKFERWDGPVCPYN